MQLLTQALYMALTLVFIMTCPLPSKLLFVRTMLSIWHSPCLSLWQHSLLPNQVKWLLHLQPSLHVWGWWTSQWSQKLPKCTRISRWEAFTARSSPINILQHKTAAKAVASEGGTLHLSVNLTWLPHTQVHQAIASLQHGVSCEHALSYNAQTRYRHIWPTWGVSIA